MNRITATATKPAARTTKTSRATPQAKTEVHTADTDVVGSDLFAEAMKRYNDAQDYLLKFFQAPSWKRTLCAFVTTIVVGAGVGWVAGTLLNWMIAGAVMMAAPLFLVVAAYVLGFIAALYYGGKLAVRVGGAILTGEADERAIAAYDAMKAKLAKLNPFGKREVVQQPAPARRRAHA